MSLQCKRKLSQLIAFFFTKINCGTNQYMIIYCCSFSFQVLHLRALNLTFTRQWKSISFMGKICLPVEHNTSFSTSIKACKQNNRTKLIFSRNMNCGSNDQDMIVKRRIISSSTLRICLSSLLAAIRKFRGRDVSSERSLTTRSEERRSYLQAKLFHLWSNTWIR